MSILLPAATIIGTPDNDDLVGTAEADTLTGGAGSDWLDGLDGDDSLFTAVGSLAEDPLAAPAPAPFTTCFRLDLPGRAATPPG